jgi:hypothetical protein
LAVEKYNRIRRVARYADQLQGMPAEVDIGACRNPAGDREGGAFKPFDKSQELVKTEAK